MDAIEEYERKLSEHQEKWNIFDEDTRVCRICGCTQYNACPGGCYWVTDDLCSQCVKYVGTDICPIKEIDNETV